MPPLVQLLAYGYVVNFDIKHVALAVFDESRSMESRQLIDRFASNDWFNVKYYVKSQKELLHLVDRGDITMALWIQWDFATRMRQGKSGRLQVIVDATDSNAALIVSRYAGTVIADYNQLQLDRRLASQGQDGAAQSGLPLSDRAPGLVQLQPHQPLFHGARRDRHGGAAGQPDADGAVGGAGKRDRHVWSRSW